MYILKTAIEPIEGPKKFNAKYHCAIFMFEFMSFLCVYFIKSNTQRLSATRIFFQNFQVLIIMRF